MNEVIKEFNLEVTHEYSSFQLEIVPLMHYKSVVETYSSLTSTLGGLKKLEEWLSKKHDCKVVLILSSTFAMLGSEMYLR